MSNARPPALRAVREDWSPAILGFRLARLGSPSYTLGYSTPQLRCYLDRRPGIQCYRCLRIASYRCLRIAEISPRFTLSYPAKSCELKVGRILGVPLAPVRQCLQIELGARAAAERWSLPRLGPASIG